MVFPLKHEYLTLTKKTSPSNSNKNSLQLQLQQKLPPTPPKNKRNVHGMMGPVALSTACNPASFTLMNVALQAADLTNSLSDEAKAMNFPSDFTSFWDAGCGASAQSAAAAGAMDDLADPSKMIDKLVSGSPSPMEQLGKYLYATCVKDCDAPTTFNAELVAENLPPNLLPVSTSVRCGFGEMFGFFWGVGFGFGEWVWGILFFWEVEFCFGKMFFLIIFFKNSSFPQSETPPKPDSRLHFQSRNRSRYGIPCLGISSPSNRSCLARRQRHLDRAGTQSCNAGFHQHLEIQGSPRFCLC